VLFCFSLVILLSNLYRVTLFTCCDIVRLFQLTLTSADCARISSNLWLYIRPCGWRQSHWCLDLLSGTHPTIYHLRFCT